MKMNSFSAGLTKRAAALMAAISLLGTALLPAVAWAQAAKPEAGAPAAAAPAQPTPPPPPAPATVKPVTAGAPETEVVENPYGLEALWKQGDFVSKGTLIILVIMSLGTFYILFTKLMQQQKIISQGKKVRASFWNSSNLREAANKLDQKSAYRAIVDDAL